MMKRISLFGVSSRRSSGSSYNCSTSASSTLVVGTELDYCDIEWFALETEIILSFLRLHPSTAVQTLLSTVMATPFLLRDSCPQ